MRDTMAPAPASFLSNLLRIFCIEAKSNFVDYIIDKKMRSFFLIILTICTVALVGATPLLLFMAAAGSMLNEADGGPPFWIAALIFLGVPWFFMTIFWRLVLRMHIKSIH